jgi:DEAD/DEAH box helicase domain-containing protein
MHVVAALLSMSEARDLGRAVGSADASWSAGVGIGGRGRVESPAGKALDLECLPQTFEPTVFLYDNYPGGVGLAGALFDLRESVVGRARELVSECPCENGCPACVGPILATDEDETTARSPKSTALTVLGLFADARVAVP